MKRPRRNLSFEILNKLYIDEKLSSKEIGQKLGISGDTIYYNLKKSGVPIRTQSEAIKNKIEKSKNDPDFKPHRYLSGEGHWNWSGGKHINKHDGYVMVYAPNHPRVQGKTYGGKGSVREHILVWEQTHGKLLPMDWIVHHINGIRSDNRPENLLAMPKKSHHAELVMQALKKRIRLLEAENLKLKSQLMLGLKSELQT